MKKWVLYFATFLVILFCSFWGYAWIYRVEFMQTAMERSCPPYKVTIGTIQVQDAQTIAIQNLSILTKESSPKLLVHIPQATLSSPTTSWLFWLLTPSTAPLHLNAVNMTMTQTAHLHFDHPSLNLLLTVDTLTVKGPDGTVTTHHHLQCPLSGVLLAATEKTTEMSKLDLGGKPKN